MLNSTLPVLRLLTLSLLLHANLVGVQAVAQSSMPGASVVQKIQLLNEAKKLPGLSSNGITIPSALLLEKLQAAAASDTLQVKALSLSAEKGQLQLLAKKGIDVLLTVDFKVRSVDWAQRSITLEFSESMQSGSDSAIGRLLGGVVLTAFALSAGQSPIRPVQQALADQPYFTINDSTNADNAYPKTLTLWLNRIPDLQETLNFGVGSVKLFDYVGIRSIHTEQDQMRVKLGTF